MKDIYYKVVQPDGLTFLGNPRIAYPVGTTVRPFEQIERNKLKMCHKGLLHASAHIGEVLTCANWIEGFKLLKVSGESIDSLNDKHGFLELDVLEELPSWQVFGPNGQQIAKLIQMYKDASRAEYDQLVSAVYRDSRGGHVPTSPPWLEIKRAAEEHHLVNAYYALTWYSYQPLFLPNDFGCRSNYVSYLVRDAMHLLLGRPYLEPSSFDAAYREIEKANPALSAAAV